MSWGRTKLIYVRDYFYLSSQLQVMQQSLHKHRHAALLCTTLTVFENKGNLTAGGALPFCSPSCSSLWEGFLPRPSTQELALCSGRHHIYPVCTAQAVRARLRLQIASGRRLLDLAPASTTPHLSWHNDDGKMGWLWENLMPCFSLAYCH